MKVRPQPRSAITGRATGVEGRRESRQGSGYPTSRVRAGDGRVARRATMVSPTASKSHVESRALYTPLGYGLVIQSKTPSDQGVLVEVKGFEPSASTMRT